MRSSLRRGHPVILGECRQKYENIYVLRLLDFVRLLMRRNDDDQP